MRYLLLALAWTAYCTLHSAMISETATGFLKRRLGDSFRFYRLFFNSIAMLTLIPVLWYSHSLRQEAIFRWEGVWLVPQYLLLACGILLVVAGGRHYSLGQFVGISQLRGASSGGWRRGWDRFEWCPRSGPASLVHRGRAALVGGRPGHGGVGRQRRAHRLHCRRNAPRGAEARPRVR
ncbi:MAG: hypothetical protein MZV70_60920 [Desulfobacterales bacterium]|nr:hypothetical protein [Desulfobacterales bacterium]MCK7513305.1 hypothetical protein [Desulfobacterales bacterium]